MKPIIRILLIVLLLVLYSCKSIALYDTSTDYDFKFDLYSQVRIPDSFLQKAHPQ